MKTIKTKQVNEIIINKSKFIGIIMPINSKEEVKGVLNDIKREYKGGTHYCYAYIIGNFQKYSDDKEPNGTAGIPILNVLKTNELKNIICIIVRYFGGIKLGTGGLARAYSECAKKVLEKSTIVTLTKGYYITISFNYKQKKKIDFILKGFKIEKKYSDKIIYKFKISECDYQNIENTIKDKIIEKKSMLIP